MWVLCHVIWWKLITNVVLLQILIRCEIKLPLALIFSSWDNENGLCSNVNIFNISNYSMKLFPPVREIVSVSDLIGYRTDNNRSWVCKPRSSWPRPSLTPNFKSRGRKEKKTWKKRKIWNKLNLKDSTPRIFQKIIKKKWRVCTVTFLLSPVLVENSSNSCSMLSSSDCVVGIYY